MTANIKNLKDLDIKNDFEDIKAKKSIPGENILSFSYSYMNIEMK